jgi:hypothetical protein
LRFANRSAAAKKVGIYVNGAKALDTQLDVADAFAVRMETLPLRAGLNTIAYVNDAATPGTVSLDRREGFGGTLLRIHRRSGRYRASRRASAGIAISSRFNPTPFQGTTYVERSTLTRTGGYEPYWMARFGSLWIFADTSDIAAKVVVRDVDILDSTYQGIFISFQKATRDALFERVTIQGAGTYGIEIDATGTATFNAVTVTGAASGGANIGAAFSVTKGPGNTGW